MKTLTLTLTTFAIMASSASADIRQPYKNWSSVVNAYTCTTFIGKDNNGLWWQWDKCRTVGHCRSFKLTVKCHKRAPWEFVAGRTQ